MMTSSFPNYLADPGKMKNNLQCDLCGSLFTEPFKKDDESKNRLMKVSQPNRWQAAFSIRFGVESL